jgi:hypothetical protein
MPVLESWNLQLSIDEVLKAQGADPDTVRFRRPKLLSITEEAIKRGNPLLKPQVAYEFYAVKKYLHERLILSPLDHNNGNQFLSGQLIAQHLARAQKVVVIVCSIGRDLEETVSSLFRVDPVLAMAMDGVGSAAVELLAIQASNYFESLARQEGLKSSIPLNPGMVGWPVEIGQPQIFSLVDSEAINIFLTDELMMMPGKSLSMVMGIGKDLSAIGSSCEYCSLKGVCNYQNHYAK